MERRVELEMLRNGSREKAEMIARNAMQTLQLQSPIPAETVDSVIASLERAAEFFTASEEYERQRIEELNRSR